MVDSKVNDAVRSTAGKAVLCWLASADNEGRPNVSPKEAWDLDEDERVIIADIASAASVRNIRYNTSVCVGFIDVFTQKGFQLYGTAVIVEREDDEFKKLGAGLTKMVEPKFTIRRLIVVNVEKVKPIIAPSYGFSPKPSEADMAQESYQTYGVRPVE